MAWSLQSHVRAFGEVATCKLHGKVGCWEVTLQFAIFTIHFIPLSTTCILHSTVRSLHLTLDTPHFTLYNVHFAIHFGHYTPHTILCTSFFCTLRSTRHAFCTTFGILHFRIYAPHSTLYTLQSTLYTLHFTLHDSHFAVHASHSTLSTLHCAS